jgi:hypothetical protein
MDEAKYEQTISILGKHYLEIFGHIINKYHF